jgi:hypothetical protein
MCQLPRTRCLERRWFDADYAETAENVELSHARDTLPRGKRAALTVKNGDSHHLDGAATYAPAPSWPHDGTMNTGKRDGSPFRMTRSSAASAASA